MKGHRRGPERALMIALVFVSLLALIAALKGLEIGGWAMGLMYPRRFSETVSREAEEFGLPEALVYAVIRAESGFDPKACSRAQARGLMQLTDQTFKWMAQEHPPENGGLDWYDVDDNVHCGCALLRRLLDHYGEPETALAAYNAGMGNVDKWLSDPERSGDGRTLKSIPFPETAAYVKKVVKSWRIYERLYPEG